MITTIIFDLSEVYLQGLKGTEDRINAAYRSAIKNPALMYMEEATKLFHGEITEEDYWQAVINEYNLKATVPELMRLVRENFREIEGTRDIIERLKQNDYKIGLLSVHVKEWIEYCENLFNFHKLFHSRLYSFEAAVSKPDERAYELLLEKLHVKSEECVFIDDSAVNLLPAKKLGMKTIQFEGAGKLISELKHLDIRI